MTDAGNANAGAKRGTPRWMLVALFVSLALNLIVVGSVAGAMWRFRAPPVWATAVTPNLLGYASTLPPERRKHIWDQTVEERRHIRPFRRDVRAAREETIKALVSEPFDRAKIERSVTIACRKRPIGTGQIERLASGIQAATQLTTPPEE